MTIVHSSYGANAVLQRPRYPQHLKIHIQLFDLAATMSDPPLSVEDRIRQFNDARNLLLEEPKYYTTVIQGILPNIGPAAPLELRRWGAEFLAEALGTPAVPSGEKETMQLHVLDQLRTMLDNRGEDAKVVVGLVQAFASIYPLALRWTINNSYDTISWEKVTAIKSRILEIWATATPSVQVCCVKLAQRIVLAQSVASGAEQRVRDHL